MLERFSGAILAAALVTVSGCSTITNPARLEEFEWGEVEDPSTVTEGMEATVALGEVFVLGHVNTPSRCYNLTATFDRDGSRATLRVRGELTNQNCSDGAGAFRYLATIRNLKRGNYELRVIHDIDNDQTREFTTEVDVR